MLSTKRSFLASIFRSTTPLPNSYRFDTDVEVLGQNRSIKEYSPEIAAQLSPLADSLYRSFDSIDKILLGPNSVITILKNTDKIDQIESKIRDLLNSKTPAHRGPVFKSEEEVVAALKKLDNASADDRIQLLLDVAIRPAMHADKGDCELIAFEDGIVKLELKGACKGCPSSTSTMKDFVEKLLTRFIPEVRGVEEVN